MKGQKYKEAMETEDKIEKRSQIPDWESEKIKTKPLLQKRKKLQERSIIMENLK